MNAELEGNTNGPDGILVLDPKRRRVDVDLDYNQNNVSTQEKLSDMGLLIGEMADPKNDYLAGAAV